MKKLQDDFTTPKQSKRLMELGVPEDSANYCYECSLIGGEKYYSRELLDDTTFSKYKRDYDSPCVDIIPCWSVGRLMEIMLLCYQFDLTSCACMRIYLTDVLQKDLVNILINEIERNKNKIYFSKLED